jgi:hypothetical protein
MPAKSQAQRAFLNMKFGHAWVQKHHFANKGKLPEHVAPSEDKPSRAKRYSAKGDGLARKKKMYG